MFTTIANKLEDKQSLHLILTKQGEEMTLVILPNQDKPEVKSLSVTGTAAELSHHLDDILGGYQGNRKTILEQLESASAAVKAEVEKKTKAKPAAKPEAKAAAPEPVTDPHVEERTALEQEKTEVESILKTLGEGFEVEPFIGGKLNPYLEKSAKGKRYLEIEARLLEIAPNQPYMAQPNPVAGSLFS
jgi:PRTRC genetic system protein E